MGPHGRRIARAGPPHAARRCEGPQPHRPRRAGQAGTVHGHPDPPAQHEARRLRGGKPARISASASPTMRISPRPSGAIPTWSCTASSSASKRAARRRPIPAPKSRSSRSTAPKPSANPPRLESQSIQIKRIRYFASLLAKGEIGPFKGTIISLNPKGLIVELADTLQQGMLPYYALGKERYFVAVRWPLRRRKPGLGLSPRTIHRGRPRRRGRTYQARGLLPARRRKAPRAPARPSRSAAPCRRLAAAGKAQIH